MAPKKKCAKQNDDADAPAAKKPKLSGGGFCPAVMTAEEVAKVSVTLDEVPRRLKKVMEEFGCAVVTGCADASELARLEGFFHSDLDELLAAAPADVSGQAAKKTAKGGKEDGEAPVVQCAGKTAKGDRCSITSKHTGQLTKFARPLKSGSLYCLRHIPAAGPPPRPVPNARPRKGPPLELSSWPLESLSHLGEGERCSQRGLPQGSFAWACRRLEAVRRVYETLHGTNELVVGLDNAFFVPPSAPVAKSNREWPHVDSNVSDPRCDTEGVALKEWDVYQGVFYVWPSVDEHASTTVVWPRSHKEAHGKMMKDPKLPAKGTTFVQLGSLSSELQSVLKPKWRQGARRVPAPAGSLVLWDSRTMHQGWSGGPRLAQPVCWEPRRRRDDAALERKLRLCALGLPSSHSASLGNPHMMLYMGQAAKLLPEVDVNIGGARTVLRSTIEPATLKSGVSAHDTWTKLAEAPWNKPLDAKLRRSLEEAVSEEIASLL